jgi:protein-L-isoaspartate(D-aspartate) O-methyltransferase
MISGAHEASRGELLITDPVLAARSAFAEELRFATHMRSSALFAAFAAVPRERFVGPGPWRIKSRWDLSEYWTTANDDPRHVYHDALIALDEKLGLNNGLPSLWAFLFDRLGVASCEHALHLGCGTGYYSAILAELVGSEGKVTAIDVYSEMIGRARGALNPWPHVAVKEADGATVSLDPADVIVVSAGATHPLPLWLHALKPSGRLLFPMTVTNGPGSMVLVARRSEDEFSARALCPVMFYDFSGARDPRVSERLRQAMARSRGGEVKSVRCDQHVDDETCWLHGDGWCLSRRDPDRLVAT